MTCKEKLKLDHPEWDELRIRLEIECNCPESHGYLADPDHCDAMADGECEKCWDREITNEGGRRVGHLIIDDLVPEEPIQGRGLRAKTGMIDEWSQMDSSKLHEQVTQASFSIKTSGKTTEFETGAHRDSRENKGRCDLIPLEVVSHVLTCDKKTGDSILDDIAKFQLTRDTTHLYYALGTFERAYSDTETMLLEVSKHYEEGAEKYGADNWKKGMPIYIYIDSAVRHYLKWLRGDKDEPHDRAFVWNLMCCIWEEDYSGRYDKCEEATDE